MQEASQTLPVSLATMPVMRLLRAHCLAVLAMGLLLLGTAAPALARMTCVISGNSTLNLGSTADACPVEDQGHQTTLTATCCEVLHVQPQRPDFVPAAAHAMAPMPDALPLPAPLSVPLALAIADVPEAAHLRPPPPLERARRMAATGVYRI
jgi:hypothetical protein